MDVELKDKQAQETQEEKPEAKEPTEEKVEQKTEPEPNPEAKEEPKPETKEDPKPETKAEDNSEELAELKRKLEEAEDLKAKLKEAESFKAQYEKAKEELAGYETSLAKIAEQKIEAIPEQFRDLVPEGTTQDKLDWLAKAEKSGLFAPKEDKSIGQSTKVNHHESNKVDMKDMTTNQKLIAGFKDFYSRK